MSDRIGSIVFKKIRTIVIIFISYFLIILKKYYSPPILLLISKLKSNIRHIYIYTLFLKRRSWWSIASYVIRNSKRIKISCLLQRTHFKKERRGGKKKDKIFLFFFSLILKISNIQTRQTCPIIPSVYIFINFFASLLSRKTLSKINKRWSMNVAFLLIRYFTLKYETSIYYVCVYLPVLFKNCPLDKLPVDINK